MHTYTTVMTMPPTANWKDILGKSVNPILNAVSNEHLVDYNKKITFIEVIIINEHQYKCLHTPLLHCHDNATNSHMVGHTGKISQTKSECHPK